MKSVRREKARALALGDESGRGDWMYSWFFIGSLFLFVLAAISFVLYAAVRV